MRANRADQSAIELRGSEGARSCGESCGEGEIAGEESYPGEEGRADDHEEGGRGGRTEERKEAKKAET